MPVSAPALHAEEVGAWSAPLHGVDLGAARPYAANTIFYRSRHLRDAVYLAAPQTLCRLDFRDCNDTTVDATATYAVTEAGLCQGGSGG